MFFYYKNVGNVFTKKQHYLLQTKDIREKERLESVKMKAWIETLSILP